MSLLEIQGATKRYQDGDASVEVFTGLDLTVNRGEFLAIIGPSGCGKTTLLDVIAGLESLDEGQVTLDGTLIDPGSAPTAYVFQDPVLLEWRTVAENIDFALRAKGIVTDRTDRVSAALERVGLESYADTYPLRLSGGQRQRVNLARALATHPQVLLMDEPFSSLDEVTARNARIDLLNVWEDTEMSVVFVTHDIHEAVILADRVVCLDHTGEIFHEESIDHERPRDMSDPPLQQTAAALTLTFFNQVE